MATSTLFYMGFSFTDKYFNDLRSELMALHGNCDGDRARSSNPDQCHSYAVIANKAESERDFFDNHEGLKFFSWEPSKHGFGVMDRYLEGLLRCTHLAAALSQCKVLLFSPQAQHLFLTDGQEVEVVNQEVLLKHYLPYGWDGGAVFTSNFSLILTLTRTSQPQPLHFPHFHLHSQTHHQPLLPLPPPASPL